MTSVRAARLTVAPIALLLACASPTERREIAPSEPPSAPTRRVLTPIVLERIDGPGEAPEDRGAVTIARVALEGRRLILLSSAERGGSSPTLADWARLEGLVLGINAAMYEPGGRASGWLVHDGRERSPDDPRFGGVLAFDPRDPSDAPFTMVGRDCPGVALDRLRARYRTLVANYRLLGCDGGPIAWVDDDAYSAAAIGRDREGRFVAIHAARPYRMRELARRLGDPALGLTDVHYVEGGPEATLYVAPEGEPPILLVGRRRRAEDRRPPGPLPLPNVLGVVAR